MKFIRYILFFAICLCYLNPTVIFAADGERVVEGILADSVSTKELNVTEGNFRGTTVVNAATYDLLTTDYILQQILLQPYYKLATYLPLLYHNHNYYRYNIR